MTYNGFYPYAFRFGSAVTIPGYNIDSDKLQRLCDDIASVPRDQIILLHNAIEWLPPHVIRELAQRIKAPDHNRMIWLLQQGETPDVLPGHDVVHINFDFIQMHIENSIYRRFDFPNLWTPDNKHYLMLLGKPYTTGRLRLLWMLSQQDQLAHARYSMVYNDSILTQCRDMLPELDDDAYMKFMQDHSQHVDQVDPFAIGMPGWHKVIYPINPELYTDVLFQVVCETLVMPDHVSVTEKTWMPIAHGCPFLILGNRGFLAELESRGYHTFRQQLAVDYDVFEDQDLRAQALIANLDVWQHGLVKYQPAIEAQLLHNQLKLKSDVAEHWAVFQQLHAVVAHGKYDVTRIIPLAPERAMWVNWYWNVRGPDWPDCVCREHFATLPESVQQEASIRFGLPIF